MSTENLSMFKAYDIRTKNNKLSNESLIILTKAVVKYYKENLKIDSVFLGRDARLHCPKIMEALLEEFLCAGIEVYYNPIQISTCQFYFTCMQKPQSAGIMITASHNPGEYVGLKLVGQKVSPIATDCGPEGGIAKIKEYYINEQSAAKSTTKAKAHVLQLQREYVDYSMKLAGVKEGDLKGLKVFGEFLSGSSGADFALAFEKAGADYTLSHSVPDGFFPSGDPNPIIESSIAPSRELVKNGDFDLGFCFDGDGDRMDLMYSDGTQVIPGLNMSLLIPYIKQIFYPVFGKDYQYKFFVDVKAIPLAIIQIAKAGIQPHIIRNGHSFIKAKLNQYQNQGYLASEEESAHYYMNFPLDANDLSKGFIATENTLFFALLSARAYKDNPKAYEQIRKLQDGVIRFREWPVSFSKGDEMPKLMNDVETYMKNKGALVIKDMDDGSDLDATLLRFNLPESFASGDIEVPEQWAQVATRISRSEDAMTRFEVVASSEKVCKELNDAVIEMANKYVSQGFATL